MLSFVWFVSVSPSVNNQELTIWMAFSLFLFACHKFLPSLSSTLRRQCFLTNPNAESLDLSQINHLKSRLGGTCVAELCGRFPSTKSARGPFSRAPWWWKFWIYTFCSATLYVMYTVGSLWDKTGGSVGTQPLMSFFFWHSFSWRPFLLTPLSLLSLNVPLSWHPLILTSLFPWGFFSNRPFFLARFFSWHPFLLKYLFLGTSESWYQILLTTVS